MGRSRSWRRRAYGKRETGSGRREEGPSGCLSKRDRRHEGLPSPFSRFPLPARDLAECAGVVQHSFMADHAPRLLAITRDISPAIEHCELTHLERTTID